MEFEAVIGMEVHVELDTRSKIFCACSTQFDALPNTNVCPVCLGLPGSMPVLNRAAVDASVAAGLALHCTISRWSKMDRKNYFYPDMAKNYQISQYDLPLCQNGWLDVILDGQTRRIGITRAHMEEDTARNVHGIGAGESGVDYNRAGVPLLEIVTEPDIRSADEAYAYLVALKQILQYIRVSDCNMEEGSLRAEANVSLRPVGSDAFGTKTEIKNVASFSGVHKAIDFEIRRQRNILESGGTVEQATRGWDADRGITFEQRSKESAHDYRYFPEPDLVPIVVDEGWEQEVRETLPELPRARFERFMSRYGLSEYDAGVLTATRDVADYFESTLVTGTDPKKAANWIMGDLQAIMAERKLDFTQCPIEPAALAEMIALIEAGTISGKIGKEILPEMLASGRRPKTLIEERGLVQISDRDALEALVHEVVAANPEPAKDYRCGNKKAFGFFMGQLMKATEGKGNPKLLTEILREALEKE